jgi:large subunit ribosomal protein L29
MKNTELLTLSVEELQQRLIAERENLQKLKFAHAISPVENPMRIKDTRRTIARILTLLRNKEAEVNS